MREAFQSPRLLLTEASAAIEGIRHIESNYYQRGSEAVDFIEIERATGVQLFKKRIPRPPFEEYGLLVFRASVAMRSALDHMMFAAATVLDPNCNPRQSKFPFGDTPAALEGDIKRNSRSVPAFILDVVRSFRPFRKTIDNPSGNEALFALNGLANSDKHRLLKPNAVGAADRFGVTLADPDADVAAVSEWDASKLELTCFRVAPRKMVTAYSMIRIVLSIDHPDVPGLVPGSEALGLIRSEVEDVLAAVEAETTRLVSAREM